MYPVFMAGTTGIGTNDNAKRTNTEENMIRDWGEGVEEREHDNSPEIWYIIRPTEKSAGGELEKKYDGGLEELMMVKKRK